MRYLKTLIFLSVVVCSNEGYRILCLFPFNGKSHFVMFDALCKGLARRGHRIDMISHFPSNTPIPNYTDIVDLSGTMENMVSSFSVEYGKSLERAMTYYLATEFGGTLCDLMGHDKMQEFIKNPPTDPPYDLIVTEYLGSICYLGFGQLLRAPVAVATSTLEMPYIDHFMGNPFNFAFFPGAFSNNAVVSTYLDRLWNFLRNSVYIQVFYYHTSEQTAVMRKYLGEDLPDIRELERNVCLALVNSHHSFHGVRPITPAVVEVGGLHIVNDQTEVTQELQAWLDSANEGLVYFSLGSLTSIETLPMNTLLDLYASFAKISPVKVLMKSNANKLPSGLPSNVIALPWIPQISVLGHRNTRIFISHGGLMGIQEAVYHGVPVIGMPIFGDQTRNINILAHKNMGIFVGIDNISEKTMDEALNALLHDPKYRESAKRVSKIFRDRPLDPLDTAIYWIEYVIKHGPDSLRSSATDMPWWKLNLIDVLATLIVCLTLIVYLLTILFKTLIKLSSLHRNAVTERDKKSKNM